MASIPMEILKAKRVGNYLIVLVKRKHPVKPYGTLLFHEEFDTYFSGHYFETYQEAFQAFLKRT